ncbi:esterase-like activity of phytase family protein [Pleomorphomonas sp. JP5]|uniref:esterase-like activity of phytase family protein n=1 Tax=Pleomorphomonas sp. JP5 TaxID=2942998 RepID=UPI0020445001|nr:esterase-like activity of phytase family protein [Pleomorphomonas sp. JP5]MCM5556542.1 esterase-like activity of phytase family protein [Pleomorphomonas sp. JP5]
MLGLFLLAADASGADIATHVIARPIAGFSVSYPSQVRFGGLDYVGGFEVRADRREVGGLSGLVIGDGGRRFLALSDDGLMVRATIERDPHGRPIGLSSASIRRLRTTKGTLSRAKSASDTESLDVYPGDGGRPFGVVSFEGRPTVMTGPMDADGFVGPMTAVALPKDTRLLQANRGFESVAALPASSGLGGRFVVLAEAAERGAKTADPPGWVIGGKAPYAFRIRRVDGYDLTDAKVGPDGRLYVLERSFSFLSGIRCRIRVFSLSDIRPGVVIDGETLLEASMSEQIDNMEGLAIWKTGGETRISLISDDNRAFLQRTLYLEFRLRSP